MKKELGMPALDPKKESEGKERKIIEGIKFSPLTRKDGQIIGYQSSSPDRKAIKLSDISFEPIRGKEYKVEIIRDTNPDDPKSGMLIVDIVLTEDDMLNEEEWKEIESNLDVAEEAKRIANQSSREIYKDTFVSPESFITQASRGDMTKEDVLLKSQPLNKRVVAKSLENEQKYNQFFEETLGEENSPERKLLAMRKKNLADALVIERMFSEDMEKLVQEEAALLETEAGELSESRLEALAEVRHEQEMMKKRKEELLNSNPEAFYGLHLKELKEFKSGLASGGIVETGYVKEKIQDVVTHLRAGKPVLIYGHLGSGKTELAMHIAEKHFSKKEALIISGSRNISLSELYGHQILALDKIEKEERDRFVKEVHEKYKEWEKENTGADEGEKDRAHDRILQIYLTRFKGGTISDFFLGPVYKAMEEGRAVIIDEVNAIPHEILISLNHILTRKAGDVINVQQDSGKEIRIKEGFGVIMTGNLNQGEERYVDRQDMDPALLSRLYKLEYDYLPQKTEGTFEQEAGQGNELYQLLLAKLMDRNGNLAAPAETEKKIWNLAKAARIIQNVFAGKEIDSAYYFKQTGVNPVRYLLKETVLSIRALDNILTQWQKEGYRHELDYYLWKEFVSQSTSASDKSYLYQILKDRFNFFQGNGWEQTPNYGTSGVVDSFNVEAPKNKSEKIVFNQPRKVIEFAYGKGPERQRWP